MDGPRMDVLTRRQRELVILPVRAALQNVLPALVRYVYVRYIAGVEGTRTPQSWGVGLEHCQFTFKQTGLGKTGKPKSRTPGYLSCVRNRIFGRAGREKDWEKRYVDANGDAAKLLVLSSMLHEQIYLLIYGEKANESSTGTPGMFSKWEVPKAITVIPPIDEDPDDVVCRWLMDVAARAILEYTKSEENSWADQANGAGTLQRLQMIIKEKHEARAWEMQLIVTGKTPVGAPPAAAPPAAAAEAPRAQLQPEIYFEDFTEEPAARPTGGIETEFNQGTRSGMITINPVHDWEDWTYLPPPGNGPRRQLSLSPDRGERVRRERSHSRDQVHDAAEAMCGLATMSGGLRRITTADILATPGSPVWTCYRSD
jgi:hypothetical protein